jgi:hypothetical protein
MATPEALVMRIGYVNALAAIVMGVSLRGTLFSRLAQTPPGPLSGNFAAAQLGADQRLGAREDLHQLLGDSIRKASRNYLNKILQHIADKGFYMIVRASLARPRRARARCMLAAKKSLRAR